jgi:hypothetical protein
MNTPWLWIIKDKRFQMGPTIPYIVGAMRVHRGADDIAPPETCKRELRELLIAMRDEVPAPECIAIQPCSTLEAFVASARPGPPQGRAFIRSPHHPDRALYYAIGSNAHDLDSLFSALWNEHKEYIVKGRFSREQRVGLSGMEWDWFPFDEEERQAIRDTLANPLRRTRSS